MHCQALRFDSRGSITKLLLLRAPPGESIEFKTASAVSLALGFPDMSSLNRRRFVKSTAVAGAPLEIGELACQIHALGGERRTQQLRKRHASYLLIRQVRNPNVTGLELPSGWRRKPGFLPSQARSLFLAKGTMRRHEKEAGADDSDRKAHENHRSSPNGR